MKRRNFLATIAAAGIGCSTAARRMVGAAAEAPFRRVRPGEPGWPSAASWERLRGEVGGRLVELRSPLDVCRSDPQGGACSDRADAALGVSTAQRRSEEPVRPAQPRTPRLNARYRGPISLRIRSTYTGASHSRGPT